VDAVSPNRRLAEVLWLEVELPVSKPSGVSSLLSTADWSSIEDPVSLPVRATARTKVSTLDPVSAEDRLNAVDWFSLLEPVSDPAVLATIDWLETPALLLSVAVNATAILKLSTLEPVSAEDMVERML
jgi:hypothetical protein